MIQKMLLCGPPVSLTAHGCASMKRETTTPEQKQKTCLALAFKNVFFPL